MEENETNYIDGFALPIPREHLAQYQAVVQEVARIWKEHGAIAYNEFVGDDLILEGTLPFPKLLGAKQDEAIIFGWVAFASKEIRELANEKVASDPRMVDLIAPLTNPSKPIFDAQRMAFGGFQSLFRSK